MDKYGRIRAYCLIQWKWIAFAFFAIVCIFISEIPLLRILIYKMDNVLVWLTSIWLAPGGQLRSALMESMECRWYSFAILIVGFAILSKFVRLMFAYVIKISCKVKASRFWVNIWTYASNWLYVVLCENEPSSAFCRWLKRRCYRRQQKKRGAPIRPLCPVTDAILTDGYERSLTEALLNDKIRNIALLGRYGAGKSSFLRTYFRESNVLWVSLASFVEENGSDANGNCVDDGDKVSLYKRLEQSVLQQLLYNARQSDIPFSRFKRILKVGWAKVALIAALMTVTFAELIAISQPKWAVNMLPMSIKSQFSRFWIVLLGATFLIVAWTIFVYKALLRLRLKMNLSIRGVDLDVCGKDDVSVFNRAIDELIYYFEELKYDALIFEDLDRFNNPLLFAKLRELNQILNESKQIPRSHKPIKFIYAIRDDVFPSIHKVKFFDFILPIYPFFNYDIAQGQIEKDIAEILQTSLSDSWMNMIRAFAPHMYDLRLWNNIWNEFQLCANFSSEEKDKQRWLAMIIFKSYFPKEFDLAHERKGLLGQIFEGHLLCALERKLKEQEVAEMKAHKDKIMSERANSVEALVRQYFVIGICPLLSPGTESINVCGESFSISEIVKPENFAKLVAKEFEIVRSIYQQNVYGGRRVVSEKYKWEYIEGKVAGGDGDFNQRRAKIDKKISGEVELIEQKIAKSVGEITRLDRMPVAEIITEYGLDYGKFIACLPNAENLSQSVNKENGAYEILFRFLSLGLIDEHYANYITQHANRALAREDLLFIQHAIVGKPLSGFTTLSSPLAVIEKLDVSTFERFDTFNRSLAKGLLFLCKEGNGASKRDEEKLKLLVGHMVKVGSISALEFMLEVLGDADVTEIDLWMDMFVACNPNFESAISTIPKAYSEAKETLTCFYVGFHDRQRPNLMLHDATKNFIAKLTDVNKFCDKSKMTHEQLSHVVVSNCIKLQDDAFANVADTRFTDIIIKNRCFELNKKNVCAILKYRGASQSEIKTRPYAALLEYSNEVLGEDSVDLPLFIGELYPTLVEDGKGEEGAYEIDRVLRRRDVETKSKAVFMAKQSKVAVEPKDEYDDDVLKVMLRVPAITMTFKNLIKVFRKIGYCGEIARFIQANAISLTYSMTDVDDGDVIKLLDCCIPDNNITDASIRIFLLRIQAVFPFSYSGASISPSRLEVLARVGAVKFSADYYLKLKQTGLGSHLALAKYFYKEFLSGFNESWLDVNDALHLLKPGKNGTTPAVGIYLLRKATKLIANNVEIAKAIAQYINLKTFRSKRVNIFSNEMLIGVINFVEDDNCRVQILLRIFDKGSVWRAMLGFRGGKIDEVNKKIKVRLHTREAKLLCEHIAKFGMHGELDSRMRDPEVTLTYE